MILPTVVQLDEEAARALVGLRVDVVSYEGAQGWKYPLSLDGAYAVIDALIAHGRVGEGPKQV